MGWFRGAVSSQPGGNEDLADEERKETAPALLLRAVLNPYVGVEKQEELNVVSGLCWDVMPSSQPNVFESASPCSDKKRIIDGAYYFNSLNLKMRLNRAMFG